jgi:hypothetical protein
MPEGADGGSGPEMFLLMIQIDALPTALILFWQMWTVGWPGQVCSLTIMPKLHKYRATMPHPDQHIDPKMLPEYQLRVIKQY